jgi:sterol 3beta-glucosyltransferase
MSTIVIAAFGSRGDVDPYTGLAQRLAAAGHRVAIAAQQPYRESVTAAGSEFRVLPGDTERATRDSAAAQALVDGTRMRPSRRMLDDMVADLRPLGPALADAAKDADLLLLPAVAALLGYHIAEGLGIPSAGLHLQPLAPTGDFPPSVLGARNFGRWGNRMLGRIGALGEKPYLSLINELRDGFGLAPTTLRGYQRRRAASWPILHGFSRHVVPRPADWPSHLHVTGYWWPAPPVDWRPPRRLADFLDAGPPPVFIGFGSTATARGEQLSEIITTAVRSARVRAVVQSGWSRLDCDGDDVITVGDVPHSWLFPRMAAVVHHCGAGTTAAALRAGVPSVPVVGIMDQPFWAKRLLLLGTATAALRRITLTAQDLAHAITQATSTPAYTRRAQHLSRLIAAEDGTSSATGIITGLLDHHQPVGDARWQPKH